MIECLSLSSLLHPLFIYLQQHLNGISAESIVTLKVDFAWLQLPLLGDAEQLDQVNAATDDCKFTIPRAFTQLSYVHGFRMTLTPWVFLKQYSYRG